MPSLRGSQASLPRPQPPDSSRTQMERELRDVVSKLAACVAMRYAAESNLRYIAETEKQQRTAWETEFSSCAHPAVILPPGGVSRRQRNRVFGSNKSSDRNEVESTPDIGVSSFSSDASNPGSQHQQQQQQQQGQQQEQEQQRFPYCQDEGSEEPQYKHNLMGSATFMFTCNNPAALEHRFKPSSNNGFGGRDARNDSTRGGNLTRWGSERAVFKGPFSPYKLEADGMPREQPHELDHGQGFCEIVSSTPSTTTANRQRRCTPVTGVATNKRHVTQPSSTTTTITTGGAIVTREGVLRRSTWLGPEVSPLPVWNEQEAARLNSPSPFAVKFAAAAWPSPRQNGRWRGLNRGIKSCRRTQGGSNKGDPERAGRPQCRSGSFQQQYSIGRGKTENNLPRGVSGTQAPPGMELGAGSTSCGTSRNSRSSACSNTETAARCSSKERLGTAGFESVRTGEVPEPPPQCHNEANPHQPEQEGGADQISDVSRTKPTGGVGCSGQKQTLSAGVSPGPSRQRGEDSASIANHDKEAAVAAGRAGGGGKLVGEWSTKDYDPTRGAGEGATPKGAANAPNMPTTDDENAGGSADACSIPRPTSADAALVPSKTRSGLVAASRSSKASIPFQFAIPELMSTVLAVRGTVGARRQQQEQQQQQRSQVLAESRPHHEQTEALVVGRQPSFQQRRNASEDQDDRSECTLSQEKHVMLLTRRLKQLVQLESLTIQWERLPRREREKLDRQQHLIGSRFRVTEQLRRDSSFDMCVVSSAEGAGFGTAAVQFGGGGGGGGGNISHQAGTNRQGIFLPPSDAAISSSIDRPQAGAKVAGIESGVAAAPDMKGKEGVRVEAGSGGLGAGKVTPDQLVARTGKAMSGGATPRGVRRRRGEGGRRKRGGMACGIQDTDIASGLSRRGRLEDPSFGIVGVRSSIKLEDQ